jgi:hypothetical protein
LVEELGYTGFQKLRKAFDLAFGGEGKVPHFDLVIDAGCGTGLVGEQVSISLFLVRCILLKPTRDCIGNSDTSSSFATLVTHW